MSSIILSILNDAILKAPTLSTSSTLFSTTTHPTLNVTTEPSGHHNSTDEEHEFHPTILNPGTPLLIVYGVALLFTIFTWVLGFWLIVLHLRYMTVPNHQKYIIRVLLICPLYAAYSLVALILMEYQVYLLIFRDAYEAYVLWQFMALCIEYIGGEQAVLEHLNGQPPMKLEIPLCCIEVNHWEKFYVWVKRGILQYMVIRPLMAIVSVILEIAGYYGDGDIFNFERGFFYVVTVQNICLTISMYCLVVFYHATTDALKPYKPLLKFISIKIILFFVFWQGVAIASLMWFGWIPRTWNLEPEEFGIALQNLIVTVEMALIAILHMYAFPVDMYRIKAQSQAPLVHEVEVDHNAIKAVGKTINQMDVVKATAAAFKIRGKRRKGGDLENGDLENDEIDFAEQFKNLSHKTQNDPNASKPHKLKFNASTAALVSSDSLADPPDPNNPDTQPSSSNAPTAPDAQNPDADLPAAKPSKSRLPKISKMFKSSKYEVLDEANPNPNSNNIPAPPSEVDVSRPSSPPPPEASSSTAPSSPHPSPVPRLSSPPISSSSSSPQASPIPPPPASIVADQGDEDTSLEIAPPPSLSNYTSPAGDSSENFLPPPPSSSSIPIATTSVDQRPPEEDDDDDIMDGLDLAAAIRTSTITRDQLDDGINLFEHDDDDLSRLPTDTYSKTAKMKARR